MSSFRLQEETSQKQSTFAQRGKGEGRRAQGKPYEVGIDGRRTCKTSWPTNFVLEEWKKMLHADRMLCKVYAKDAEKIRRSGLRSIRRIDNAEDEELRREVAFRVLEATCGTGAWV